MPGLIWNGRWARVSGVYYREDDSCRCVGKFWFIGHVKNKISTGTAD